MTPINPEPTNRFVLKFHSDIARTIRINIPRARTDKTPAEVEASMRALINDGDGVVFVPNKGVLSEIKGAQLVETRRRVLI